MENIPEFLKSNDHHLKFCILYEVAQKKPIFDSYRTFCDTVGQDAMEYPDFKFWYHRFSQGELEFDYDRSKDPVPKTLMDIPVNLVRRIAENLDPMERSSLRSTNHDIKELSDSLPPVFENINITTSVEKIEWRLNDVQFKCRKSGSDCVFSKPKFHKECYIKKSLEYLTPIFKMPKIRVDYLSLINMEERDHVHGNRRQMPDLDDLLPASFLVKEVHIDGYDVNRVLHFLTAMTPGHLESISLGFDGMWNLGRENLEVIFETYQLKQAKEVSIDYNVEFQLEDLANFSHSRSFKCRLMDNMEPEEILRIPDIVSKFEEFESCDVSFFHDMHRYPMNRFPEGLGVVIPEGEEHSERFTFQYQKPGSNERLEFEMGDSGIQCFIEIRKIQ